jgi:DUF971 family protein
MTIRKLSEVGRYAIGVVFSDGHDSILPYRELRAHCPCEACAAEPASPPAAPPPAVQVADLERIGDATLFLRWADGHETLLVADELRRLCRCAHCIGEPSYPISRQ